MADEEAAGVVDQQLVELRLHRARHAQGFGDLSQHPLEVFGPAPPADAHTRGIYLPGPAHAGIHQGLGAATVGGRLGQLDDLLRLHGQERQGKGAHSLHFQMGRMDVDASEGVEIARTLDLLQQLGKLVGKRQHGDHYR